MNNRFTRTLLGAALTAVTALALSGCATAAPQSDTKGALRVVATTTQLGDFTKEIGGDDVQLTTLLAPGASAHHFDPSPEQLLALGKAQVLVQNGAGLEGFVDSAVTASGFSGKVVTAADGIDLALAKSITEEGGGYVDDDDDHDHADHDHADHDHAADDADHEHDEADHDHGDLNPHIWTSPVFAEGMVREITDALVAASPTHADAFRERSDAYLKKLEALNTWVTAQVKAVPADQRLFVSGHDAMRYYLHDYDIQYVGSLLPSFEDNAEPSAAQIDKLIAEIKNRGVKAIFTESSINPKLAETVAKQTGVKWISGENALYVDALGAKGTGAENYIDATVHNTKTILEAWGFTPEPLPEVLAGP